MAGTSMTAATERRVCALRYPGTSRARFVDAGTFELHVGDWVVTPSIAGEEAGKMVVAPDQWLSPVEMDVSAHVTRLLDDAEIQSVVENMLRARGSIDAAASAVRQIEPSIFLSGLRFNLAGDRAIAMYVGPAPEKGERIGAALEQALGVPVVLEQESSRSPDNWIQGGGVGKITPERPETFHELLRQRIDVLREPGTFAPQGIPRMGSRVKTPQGSGQLVAVDIRHWKATVRIGDDDEVTVSVDELTQPSSD